MSYAQLAAPDLQGAFETTAPETTTRTTITDEQKNNLYIAAYPALLDLCYETYPHLMFSDAETTLRVLAERVQKYNGKPDGAAFMKWASKFVSKEAKRYEITERILRQYRSAIFSTIHLNMWTSAMDRSVTADDLFLGIALYIFEDAHSFDRPGYSKEDGGNVKLLTRLCSLAKTHTYLYYNSPQTTRKRRVEKNFAKGKFIQECEVLSPAEIAAMKPQPEAYDSGYSEIGLLE